MEENTFIDLFVFRQMKVKEIETLLAISPKQRKELEEQYHEEIVDMQHIRKKFTKARQEYFKDYKEFYYWYKSQKQECSYCGVTQDELYKIFPSTLPLNDAVKRSSGTLEIERLNSVTNEYSKENIALACPLCNNAKSNLIDEKSWRDLFAKPMFNYYQSLLKEIKE